MIKHSVFFYLFQSIQTFNLLISSKYFKSNNKINFLFFMDLIFTTNP